MGGSSYETTRLFARFVSYASSDSAYRGNRYPFQTVGLMPPPITFHHAHCFQPRGPRSAGTWPARHGPLVAL